MKIRKVYKKVLLVVSLLVLTACGGDSSTSQTTVDNNGTVVNGIETTVDTNVLKLKKTLTYNEKDVLTMEEEYKYNSNQLAEEWIANITTAGTFISEYTYDQMNNHIKTVTNYWVDGILESTSTSSGLFSGDKLIFSREETIYPENFVTNHSLEMNLTNYEGIIATKQTIRFYDSKNQVTSAQEQLSTAVNNKEIKRLRWVTHNPSNVSTTLFTYDLLDRRTSMSVISDNSSSETHFRYDADTSMIEPAFSCFGGHVQLAKNERIKYPNLPNECYLKTGIEVNNINNTTNIFTYTHKFNNDGLVIERVMKFNDKLVKTIKYEYE